MVDRLDGQRHAMLRRLDDLSLRVGDAKSAAAAGCRPLGHAERCTLARAVAALPQQAWETAMSLVYARHPELLPQGAGGDTCLDFDALDALTLRQLQSLAAWTGGGPGGGGGEGAPRASWPGLVLGAGAPCVFSLGL